MIPSLLLQDKVQLDFAVVLAWILQKGTVNGIVRYWDSELGRVELRQVSCFSGYIVTGEDGTIHVSVAHSKGQYARGLAHTNTLENVWSLFKRSNVGSYHQISMKHIDRDLDEFEFRFNNPHRPYLFRDTQRAD